jgi:hypothetical protein
VPIREKFRNDPKGQRYHKDGWEWEKRDNDIAPIAPLTSGPAGGPEIAATALSGAAMPGKQPSGMAGTLPAEGDWVADFIDAARPLLTATVAAEPKGLVSRRDIQERVASKFEDAVRAKLREIGKRGMKAEIGPLIKQIEEMRRAMVGAEYAYRKGHTEEVQQIDRRYRELIQQLRKGKEIEGL